MTSQAEVAVRGPVPAAGKLKYPPDLIGAALRVREIRRDLTALTVTWKSLVGHIAQAYDQRDWVTLGYKSWREYCEAEFAPAHLPRASKDELAAVVRNLATAESRMSTRAIADALGISQSTAARLARSPESSDSPERVTGTDGKTYPTRAPKIALMLARAKIVVPEPEPEPAPEPVKGKVVIQPEPEVELDRVPAKIKLIPPEVVAEAKARSEAKARQAGQALLRSLAGRLLAELAINDGPDDPETMQVLGDVWAAIDLRRDGWQAS